MGAADDAIDQLLGLGDRELAWIGRAEGDMKGLTQLAQLLKADPDGMVKETVALARAFLNEHPLVVVDHGQEHAICEEIPPRVGKPGFVRVLCRGESCSWRMGPPRRDPKSLTFDRAAHDRAVLIELRTMAVEGDPVRDAPAEPLPVKLVDRVLTGEREADPELTHEEIAEELAREADQLHAFDHGGYDRVTPADESTPITGIGMDPDMKG